MIFIEKGKEPASLLAYRKKQGACYAGLPKAVAADLREQMWKEQKGLCAYCMCKIEDAANVKIEHYSPRHANSGAPEAEDALLYRNLLAVCYGNSSKKGIKLHDQTCDAHKGNQTLTVDPLDRTSVCKIKYNSDGTITSEDIHIRKDIQETLNLNCQARSLPQNRKNVLLQAKKELDKRCRGAGKDAYKAACRKLYQRYTRQKQLEPYCGIVIAWLEKKLKL